ncbi:MAG TPA: hypothetical protein PKL45_00275 [Bacteroidia bacterium]|nr:hypothetical protein [Bacteroidia bacterium]
MEKRKVNKASRRFAVLFSFLTKKKTIETKMPCMAANKKMVVHVLKDGDCIGSKKIQMETKLVKSYNNLPFSSGFS